MTCNEMAQAIPETKRRSFSKRLTCSSISATLRRRIWPTGELDCCGHHPDRKWPFRRALLAARGRYGAPGLYSTAKVAGWNAITQAVDCNCRHSAWKRTATTG